MIFGCTIICFNHIIPLSWFSILAASEALFLLHSIISNMKPNWVHAQSLSFFLYHLRCSQLLFHYHLWHRLIPNLTWQSYLVRGYSSQPLMKCFHRFAILRRYIYASEARYLMWCKTCHQECDSMRSRFINGRLTICKHLDHCEPTDIYLLYVIKF